MAFEREMWGMNSRLDAEMQHKAEIRKENEREKRFDDEVLNPIKENAVRMESFATGPMTAQEIRGDLDKIKEIESSPDFVKEREREADVLEAAVQQLFEIGAFGDVVKFVKKTAVYDDYVRGIDFYVDIGEGEERVLLGIDTTISGNVETLKRKVERNVNAAMDNKLPAVKYFVDIDGNSHREQEMPRVILGVDRKTTLEIRNKVIENPDNLEDDTMIHLMIDEMLGQLEMLESLAPEKSKSKKMYARAVERIKEMCKEKGLDTDELREAFKDDALANPTDLLS